MKIKTAELEGPRLDYAVALAVGLPVYVTGVNWPGNGKVYAESFEHPVITLGFYRDVFIEHHGITGPYRPSIDGKVGMHLIQKYRCALDAPGCDDDPWMAGIKTGNTRQYYLGPTPLIAAMRALVGHLLGDEVEVPE